MPPEKEIDEMPVATNYVDLVPSPQTGNLGIYMQLAD